MVNSLSQWYQQFLSFNLVQPVKSTCGVRTNDMIPLHLIEIFMTAKFNCSFQENFQLLVSPTVVSGLSI